MKKNIYIFDEITPSSHYGIGRYICQFVKLFKDSHKLHIVIFNSNTTMYKTEIKDGVEYIYFPNLITLPNYSNEIYYNNCFYLLRKYHPLQSNDILIFNHYAHKYTMKSMKLYYPNSQIIYIVHFFLWSFLLHGNYCLFKKIVNKQGDVFNDKILKQVYNCFLNDLEIFSLSNKVVCLSQFSKQILLNDYHINNIHLIRNGLENNELVLNKIRLREKYHIDKYEKVIIFVGRLHQDKGIVELIEAFKKLKYNDNVTRYRLLIVGDGDMKICYNTTNDCLFSIIFTGYISFEKLKEMYAISDIGVLPSYHEQCSLAAIEMMSFGLPLITSDAIGFSEMVLDGYNGFKVAIGNDKNVYIDELANNIKYLLSNQELMDSFGLASYQIYTEKYSLSKMHDGYVKLFNTKGL